VQYHKYTRVFLRYRGSGLVDVYRCSIGVQLYRSSAGIHGYMNSTKVEWVK